jgi:predicted nucleic acid-binding protein
MHQIVIDTSVAALHSNRGASYRLLEMVDDSRWQLNVSVALALEYEAIGKREAAKLGISETAIDDIVDVLCETSRHHAVRYRLRPELSDPDDEPLVQLASESAAVI